MSYSNQATLNSNRVSSKQNWWQKLFNLFNAGSISGELTQDSSILLEHSKELRLDAEALKLRNPQINYSDLYKTEVRSDKSFSLRILTSDSKRLEGDRSYNSFNQFR